MSRFFFKFKFLTFAIFEYLLNTHLYIIKKLYTNIGIYQNTYH